MLLQRVLCEWVSRQQEHATVQSLKKALNGNLVNLGSVATDLEQTLVDHGIDLEKEDPQPPT